MEINALITMGQVAGIGGLALGVCLILFREIIRKNIFPKLEKADAYQLLRLITILIFLTTAIGMGAWLWIHKQYSAGKVVEDQSDSTVIFEDLQEIENNSKQCEITIVSSSPLNAIVFNASSYQNSHLLFSNKLKKLVPNASVDQSFDWAYRWRMEITRIFYLGHHSKKYAVTVGEALPIIPEVINYYEQLEQRMYFPDRHGGSWSKMVGISPRRNLAIFVGEDLAEYMENNYSCYVT